VLTQAESGILHVDDHHRHQHHHDQVYDVEHHSRAVSYDILRHRRIKRYPVAVQQEVVTARPTNVAPADLDERNDQETCGAERGFPRKMPRVVGMHANYNIVRLFIRFERIASLSRTIRVLDVAQINFWLLW